MFPLTFLLCSLNSLVSKCPNRICAIITVLVLGILPLMTSYAQEGVTTPKFLSQTTNAYLPGDTLTEYQQLPKLVRVTKAASRGVTTTTSTVRPWPSHNFFRSILSKTDNVVTKTKTRNRSKIVKRKSHETETKVHKNASSLHNRKGQENSTENFRPRNNDSNMRRPLKTYHVANRKKDNEKEKIENISATLKGNESQITLNENNTRARSVTIRSEERLTNISSEVVSQRKFSSPSKENHEQTMHNVKEYNHSNKKVEDVTKQPSEVENSTVNKVLKEASESDEYSYINSPQVGFQYEIVVPPPTTESTSPRPPLATSFKLTTEKASLNHAPTSAGVSTTLHVFYTKEPDGSNNNDAEADSSENNRNTSISTISAVTMNDTRRRVTNDDTPTTISPPLPFGSQLEEKKVAAATTLVPPPPPPSSSSTFPDTSYNKSNEMISQNPQNTSALLLLSAASPPPTQQQQPPLQSNTSLVKGNGENITSNNKSHLPHCLKGECLERENASEIHTEIKKNDPWTINHNSGNDESANKASLVETSTFLPVLKKEDYRLNSSSVNSLMAFPLDTSITTIHPFFATHEWTSPPPTQFYSHKTTPSIQFQQVQKKGAHILKIERPNNSFQKRISHNRESANASDTNYHTIPRQERLRLNRTTLINRRNMFTVVKGEITNPKIHVESTNTTSASEFNRKSSTIKKSGLPGRNPSDINTLLHDQANQVERPSISSSILTGHDRMILSSVSPPPPKRYTQKDNDYFDEDDSQANLHRWIESDQGHFVTPSTELPKFTNLTWPYYFPKSDIELDKNSQGNLTSGLGVSGISSGPSSSASTALDVSINSKRKGKPSSDFNSNFEFYIPSAAADPHQNPILLGKRPTNKTAHVNYYETWTKAPAAEASTMKHLQNDDEQLLNYFEQIGHKSKIKQSHWGSNGLSIKPQNSHKVNSHSLQTSSIKRGEQQPNKIKEYESSTGNPKTSSTMFPSTRAPTGIPTFTIYSNAGNKYQNHFFTSPSSSSTLFGSTLPFDSGKVVGQSETASFVTSKTPTNIWYKPIINHFTASVPLNGTTTLYDNFPDKVFNNGYGSGGGIFTTTMKPPASSMHKIYVGENHDDDTFYVANKIREKTQKSKSNFSSIPEKQKPDKKSTILFKVWNLDADGKLKLENQREIPAWALQGYLIPASGTILNLQQIPSALQPLVTSALAMNKEAEYSILSTTTSPYIWKPLPILGSGLNGANDFAIITPSPSRPTVTKTTIFSTVSPVVSTPITPDESLFDNASNQIKFPASQMGGYGEEKEVMHNKQPISINYVLWNNPASNHGQPIVLSTPTPTQIPLSQPTPVTYFPSSTITSVENIPLSSVTIKHPGSSTNSYITTTTPRTAATKMNPEKLELLFQNYFQYFITTSTPAPTTTSTPPAPLSISLANKVTQTYGQETDNSKAWMDLKKLILRLANNNKGSTDTNQASDTQNGDKTGDLDYLGNVAAIALIMSYIRNQYEQGSEVSTQAITKPHSTSTTPYGFTDDMEPPHKDQLWATVYPLFQHLLNNPNYTFIPPPRPPPHSSNQQLLSETSSYSLSSMTPTSPGPIPFTEPITGTSGNTGTSNYDNPYNHYATYHHAITTPRASLFTSISRLSITKVPKKPRRRSRFRIRTTTTTTEEPFPTEQEQIFDDPYDYLATTEETSTHKPQKAKTLLLLKALKKKKKKKKLKKAAPILIGGGLVKKIGPLLGIMKKPKKYWLDMKFEIDFIDILKKKLLYMLAVKYMPVVMVLALGATPLALSLVPLLYKMYWMKFKKPKYIKVPVKVPVKVPYPKPYPVPVYKHPPPLPPYHHHHGHQGYHHYGSHSPLHEQLQRPEVRYNENEQYHHHDQNPGVIHVDSPPSPMIIDHHYAADSSGKGNSNDEHAAQHFYKKSELPEHEIRGDYPEAVNSFNYDYVRQSTPNTHAGMFQQEQNDEIHVHLHDDDDESRPLPLFHQAPVAVTYSPSLAYTSYTEKDLQPFPVTNGYGMGFDIGQTLGGMTNKQDMEILKILVDTKKEKLNKLLDVWNLAKYGVAVASETAMTYLRGPTTPLYPGMQHGKKKRRKRRKKRKHEDLPISENITKNHTVSLST